MKKTISIFVTCEVEIDETKLTPEFMEIFRRIMVPAFDADDHLDYLALLTARGYVGPNANENFIDGYGEQKNFGIRGRVVRDGVIEGDFEERS